MVNTTWSRATSTTTPGSTPVLATAGNVAIATMPQPRYWPTNPSFRGARALPPLGNKKPTTC
eukprot:854703-Lingulodinium_polyedra.AAC.1